MNFLRIVAAGVLYTVISMVIHTLSAIIEMPYYLTQDYFLVWSKLLMPAGPPGMEFYAASFVFTLIAGLILAGVYSGIKASIHGKGIGKGIRFGFGIFLVTGIPAMLSLVLLINLPLGLIAIWTIDSFIISLLGGIVIESLVR